MELCAGCGRSNVDRFADAPRYDVLADGFDAVIDDPTSVGPYCADCFAATMTGQLVGVAEDE